MMTSCVGVGGSGFGCGELVEYNNNIVPRAGTVPACNHARICKHTEILPCAGYVCMPAGLSLSVGLAW